MQSTINIIQIENGKNNFPRFICNYKDIVNEENFNFSSKNAAGKIIFTTEQIVQLVHKMSTKELAIKEAAKLLSKAGGKKYNTKKYPDYFVFNEVDFNQVQKNILSVLLLNEYKINLVN